MNIEGKVDPTGYFKAKKVKAAPLVEACGIIPMFVHEASSREPQNARELFKEMCNIYGFGDYEMEGGSVDLKGVYSYPEDSDLQPLVRMHVQGEELDAEVFIYQYAIVCVRDKAETIITRMD